MVLSDDARVMERSVGGLPLPLDGGRVVLAPADAAGMHAAPATALRSGVPGNGIAVAASGHLLLAEPMAAAEWWPAVRSGTVRMVSLGAEEGAADRQFLARLWRAGVAPGHITLEELAAPAVLAAGAAPGPAGEGAPPAGLRRRSGGARPGGASPSLSCAVERRCVPAGANPARQLSLQPEAVGAVQGGNELH